MAKEKVVTVNFVLLRKKVTDKARLVVAGVTQKVSSTGRKIGDQASAKAHHAIGGALDKSISILEKARQKYKSA